MPDLLVRLYDLPENTAKIKCQQEGVTIRLAIAPELHIVQDFVEKNFSKGWASEATVGFARSPVSVALAVENREIVGFAVFDATYRAFFGPTGVLESHRGRGIGQALLIEALEGLYKMGYGYGIIGSVGEALGFYQKCLEVQTIEGSVPGVYKGML